MSDRSLEQRFGSAKHPDRPMDRGNPAMANGATIDALGKLSEALEVVENARGHLYEFHRMSGRADLALQDAVTALRDAGHADTANSIDETLVGRDVLPGLWTYQIVETYDDGYWSVFRAVEQQVRAQLAGGVRHLFEAQLKVAEQGGPPGGAR